MRTVIYVHGFNSSPLSKKANIIKKKIDVLSTAISFFCPQLPELASSAIGLLSQLIEDVPPGNVCLIGSSLGGFYATWLAERYGCRAVIINPAITPHEDLKDYLGPQENIYTHHSYYFTEKHLKGLKNFYLNKLKRPQLFFLIHATGDELLDWRIAKSYFAGSRQLIVEGGDHGFTEIEKVLDPAFKFLEIG